MNKDPSLSEREFEIINVVALGLNTTQRDLSARTAMSLGLTNLLLKRLVRKGYLKVRQLNAKKVEYLLTPRGFAEKAQKSYRYTLKTIHSLVSIKSQIRLVLESEIAYGRNEFILVGQGDIQDLVELSMRNMDASSFRLTRANSYKEIQPGQNLVVIGSPGHDSPVDGLRQLDILSVLAQNFPNSNIVRPLSQKAEAVKVEV